MAPATPRNWKMNAPLTKIELLIPFARQHGLVQLRFGTNSKNEKQKIRKHKSTKTQTDKTKTKTTNKK